MITRRRHLELEVSPLNSLFGWTSKGLTEEVPAVPFHENVIRRLNEAIKIFVYSIFNAKFRRIFTQMKIQHTSSTE